MGAHVVLKWIVRMLQLALLLRWQQRAYMQNSMRVLDHRKRQGVERMQEA